MAFLLDSHDPSSSGMFSKPGRFTSEKYIIFQKKDEILNNQRKFLKVSALPHLKMDYDGKEHGKNAPEDVIAKPKAMSTKNTSRMEPFSQQVSREDFYEVKKVKNPPPPFGFYNPKYDYVDKVERPLFNYDKEKKKERSITMNTTMTELSIDEASRPIPDKLQKKVIGPVPFHLQQGKGSLLSPNNHPHEERFSFIPTPKNLGKNKRLKDVNMNKTLGRDYKFLFKDQEYAPDYDPKFEFGRKRLGSCGAPFQTHSPRKPMHYTSSCTNENFYDTSKSETFKYFKTQKTGFEIFSPRDYDSSSPLPSFMQKSVNSRIAVGKLSQKMLESNGFCDGKFQTVTTSFSPVKKSGKKDL